MVSQLVPKLATSESLRIGTARSARPEPSGRSANIGEQHFFNKLRLDDLIETVAAK
jgi:hypothetical protein